MTISFNSIPNDLRVPFVAVEFDASKAQQGPALLAYRGLLIGQKLAGGAQAADTAVKVSNEDQVIAAAGRGSMLHNDYLAWRAVNKSTELWLGVLADDGAGVAATGTITVTGPATAAGTIALYLAGVRLTVGVNSGDAQNAIATAIAAAITAAADLPVTAAAVANVVTITYRHKGLVGNSYNVRHSFRDGEALPAGVALAIVQVGSAVAGTTNPSLANLIAAISDMWFQVWTHPYTDATSLTAIENELISRWGPLRQTGGIAITSASGSFSTLSTLGAGRNSPLSLIVAQPGVTPLTTPAQFAAEVAGLVAYYGSIDPARPFKTLAMVNAIAPGETDQFDITERNLLLKTGIATTIRVTGGGVQLERMITTYETSASGAPDTAYLDATTPLTLIYLRYSFRVRIQTKYPRHKLANDGTRFGAGQAVITPKIGKGEALSWFREMEALALVEGFDQFKRDLICERNTSNPNELDWLLPPDLINQFQIAAAKMQFLV